MQNFLPEDRLRWVSAEPQATIMADRSRRGQSWHGYGKRAPGALNGNLVAIGNVHLCDDDYLSGRGRHSGGGSASAKLVAAARPCARLRPC